VEGYQGYVKTKGSLIDIKYSFVKIGGYFINNND